MINFSGIWCMEVTAQALGKQHISCETCFNIDPHFAFFGDAHRNSLL